VVYVGPHAVPGAIEGIRAAHEQGVRCCYITNNASRPPAEVVEHLRSLGIDAAAEEVVTSAQAGVSLLAQIVPAHSRILAIGGPGVFAALRERGFVPVESADDEPAGVLQGIGMDLSWPALAEATFAVAAGLPWIATNLDSTFPTPRGLAPGNGAMVEAVAHATGRRPNGVGGKPEPALLLEAVARTGSLRPLMIGDRLDTDIAAANRLGMPTLLVMTGVTGESELAAAAGLEVPTYVAPDLSCLGEETSWQTLKWAKR
ncbi:MAG: HAD-IIA family hydrolase, partial [Candidatus Nanopelagicales bacterium]|nr:HAD-IIA family hydrolase [Candidatus Nanopelagicales bacterium]